MVSIENDCISRCRQGMEYNNTNYHHRHYTAFVCASVIVYNDVTDVVRYVTEFAPLGEIVEGLSEEQRQYPIPRLLSPNY